MHWERRDRIWRENNAICGICGTFVSMIGCEIEHRIALHHGGMDADDNCYPVHPECHKSKTRADRKVSAKINRIHRRITNSRRKRKAIASRGFQKKLRRLFSGQVVVRS